MRSNRSAWRAHAQRNFRELTFDGAPVLAGLMFGGGATVAVGSRVSGLLRPWSFTPPLGPGAQPAPLTRGEHGSSAVGPRLALAFEF